MRRRLLRLAPLTSATPLAISLRLSLPPRLLLLLSAVIGIALGHVLYYMSIARLGVAVSAGVLQLHPFMVGVASLLLFGEVLTMAQWISGGVAILGAMMMLSVQGGVKRVRGRAG